MKDQKITSSSLTTTLLWFFLEYEEMNVKKVFKLIITIIKKNGKKEINNGK